MLIRNAFFLAPVVAILAGCAHTPPPCMLEEQRADTVLKNGFWGDEAATRAQWSRVMSYMKCAYNPAGKTGLDRLESIKGFESAVDPVDARFFFEDRQQWRQKMAEWAKKRPDDRLERAVAKDHESAKEFKQAHEIYLQIYKTKNREAGHDVAFGLLHGWDGGKPDAYAAKAWYAKTYLETGVQKSLKACQVIESQRAKRTRNQDLDFCTGEQR